MKIIVDHTSMQPIYEQIVEQIKKQILQGTLREGAPLDSVRMLAKDLKVSALTVKKAYDALEEEQLIATVHGKGSFVLGVNPSLLAEEQKREIEQRMEQLVAKARASKRVAVVSSVAVRPPASRGMTRRRGTRTVGMRIDRTKRKVPSPTRMRCGAVAAMQSAFRLVFIQCTNHLTTPALMGCAPWRAWVCC